MIKHLILLKSQNMIDINVDLLQWSIHFLIKKTSGAVATLANKTSFKNEIISNDLTKDLDFYHVLFIFIANMHRLFL